MARLPTVGGDDNNWGTVLNDFLMVEHEADGTLKPGGSLAGKADTTHTHTQSDVTGLAAALDDKVTEAEVDALVQQALEDHTPGIELGYAERTTSYTAGNSDITGLSVVVAGQGRPVDVEFYCPMGFHSVSGTIIRADIKQDGVIIQSWFELTSNVSFGRSAYLKKRTGVLTDGVSYTFTIGTFQSAAGSMTWFASNSPDRKMTLSVVSR